MDNVPNRKIAAAWREEIEARTHAGESCRQIADALIAKGITVSHKTISRYRISWGLRSRAESSAKGRSKPRPSKRGVNWRDQAHAHRETIVRLTSEGKSAEEIADVAAAEGFPFKAGSTTVWRLQTLWGLIPHDRDRAKGKGQFKRTRPATGEKSPRKPKQPGAEKGGTKAARRHPNPLENTPPLRYPAGCSLGPKANGLRPIMAPEEHNLDPALCQPIPVTSDEPDADGFDDRVTVGPLNTVVEGELSTVDVLSPTQSYQPQSGACSGDAGDNVNSSLRIDEASSVSTADQSRRAVVDDNDLMSAELLVDLANSTYVAASKLKDLIVAAHQHRPVSGGTGHLPPTAAEITEARLKLQEAAQVVINFAVG